MKSQYFTVMRERQALFGRVTEFLGRDGLFWIATATPEKFKDRKSAAECAEKLKESQHPFKADYYVLGPKGGRYEV